VEVRSGRPQPLSKTWFPELFFPLFFDLPFFFFYHFVGFEPSCPRSIVEIASQKSRTSPPCRSFPGTSFSFLSRTWTELAVVTAPRYGSFSFTLAPLLPLLFSSFPLPLVAFDVSLRFTILTSYRGLFSFPKRRNFLYSRRKASLRDLLVVVLNL